MAEFGAPLLIPQFPTGAPVQRSGDAGWITCTPDAKDLADIFVQCDKLAEWV